jgi:hypothetical protein
MGIRLFDRRAALTVDTIRIESTLRFAFNVTKDAKATPNKATIKVWNMNPSHQQQLASLAPTGVTVQLEAGYREGMSLVFLGTLNVCHTNREGPDLVTTLESGDGGKQIQQSRISASFAPGTSNQNVLKAVAFAVGVGPGNLNEAAAMLGGASVFANGTVAFGSAADEMTRICRSLDLEWSVQNGKLQILPRGRALEGKAVRLSKDTGMLGEPSIDPKGVLSVMSELQPDLFPGRLLVLDATRLKGRFRIEQTVHSGDTRTTDPWQVAIQGKRY